MNKTLLGFFFVFFFAFSHRSGAQSLPPLQPEQDACNALSLCGGTFYTPYSYTGFGQIQEQTFANACFYEGNSVWFKFTVSTPGTIVFSITPVINTNDYDFAVYNITGTNCSNLTPANRIRCSGADIGSTPGGVTGLNTTSTVTTTGPGPGVQYLQQITAAAGDTYLLMIDNFETVNVAGFTLNFAGTTATFSDGGAPTITSHVPSCGFSSEIVLNTSEPVQCSSIAANGSDFSLTPSGTVASAVGVQCSGNNGYTNKIKVTFNPQLAPGNYVLHVNTGSDNNTILDLCGTAMSTMETHSFTVLPYSGPVMTVDTPACKTIRLRYDRYIKCSTVAPNGSDFTITGPSPVQVLSAKPVGCTALGIADTVTLDLAYSILKPGLYTLTPVTGTDNNSVTDTCLLGATQPTTFYVSDQGLISATASPDVLCEPGYVQLASAPEFQLPPPLTTCGPHSGALPTTSPLTIPFGTGTGTSGTASPFYNFYEDVKTQILLRAADLLAAGLQKGTLTSMAFEITSKGTVYPLSGLTIKMGCTSVSTLNSSLQPAPPTAVWGPTTYTTTLGVNTFNFTTPYDWDGASNILIEFCFDNSQWSGSADILRVTPAGYQAMWRIWQDGSAGCTMTSASFSAGENNRPNITFGQRPVPISTYDQKWYPSTFVGDSTAFNSLAYVPRTQTYTIQIKDTVGCYRRASATVTVSERNPYLLSNDTALCLGYSHQLLAGPAASYQWFPADGLSCTQCADPIATPLATTTYYVALFDQYGCSDTLKTTVTVNAPPVLRTSFEDSTIIWGQPVQLYVTAPGGKYYLWDPETDLNSATLPNPVARPEVSTTYRVMVIDTNNCYAYDSLRVRVRTDVPVFVPDAFTPNGDGRNDVFRVTKLSIQRVMEFRVFNRWGQQVFESNDGSQGWDGQFGGRPSEPGTYSYLVRVAWPDGTVERRTGTVLLIR